MGKYLWLILSYLSSQKKPKNDAGIVAFSNRNQGGSLTLSMKPFKKSVRLLILKSEVYYIFPRFFFSRVVKIE